VELSLPQDFARSSVWPYRQGFWRFVVAPEICAVNFGFVASLIVIILAVLSVFIEIPIVSNYAFWFSVGAYILLAGTAFGD
jgi:hypothetical protein